MLCYNFRKEELSQMVARILLHWFQTPTSAILIASLEQHPEKIWIDDQEKPGMAVVFEQHGCYVTGDVLSKAGIDKIMSWIEEYQCRRYDIIPQNDCIREQFCTWNLPEISSYHSTHTYRHLMDIDLNKADIEKLEEYKSQLPAEYEIHSIDEALFQIARCDKYLAQFIENYQDYEDFRQKGFGFFVLQDQEIVGGISSYVSYKTGVEVQVAVNPKHRGKHLARTLGADFLLECKERNCYPWWDCANPASESVALQLGYSLKQVTDVYRVER